MDHVVPIVWESGRTTLQGDCCQQRSFQGPCVLKKIFRVDPERRQQRDCNEKRLRCVSDLMIFHATYTVDRNLQNSVGVFDMDDRQEPPNDVPRVAYCSESGLGHACVKSAFLVLFTCFLDLFAKDGWIL
jgi:hypothetical protein